MLSTPLFSSINLPTVVPARRRSVPMHFKGSRIHKRENAEPPVRHRYLFIRSIKGPNVWSTNHRWAEAMASVVQETALGIRQGSFASFDILASTVAQAYRSYKVQEWQSRLAHLTEDQKAQVNRLYEDAAQLHPEDVARVFEQCMARIGSVPADPFSDNPYSFGLLRDSANYIEMEEKYQPYMRPAAAYVRKKRAQVKADPLIRKNLKQLPLSYNNQEKRWYKTYEYTNCIPIEGQEVTLSRTWVVYTREDNDKAWKLHTTAWEAAPKESFPLLLLQLRRDYQRYLELIRKPTLRKGGSEIVRTVAEIQWLFFQMMPYRRGSAGIGDMVGKALLEAAGFELGPWKVDSLPDMAAFTHDCPEYQQQYPYLSETPPRYVLTGSVIARLT